MMVDKIRELVEKHTALIVDAYDFIWKNPETGYREEKTAAYLAEKFEALEYELTKAEPRKQMKAARVGGFLNMLNPQGSVRGKFPALSSFPL